MMKSEHFKKQRAVSSSCEDKSEVDAGSRLKKMIINTWIPGILNDDFSKVQ